MVLGGAQVHGVGRRHAASWRSPRVRQAGHTRTPAALGQTGACRDSLVSGPSLAVGAKRALQHHETQNVLQEFLPVALR